mgnify:CR=1 FL=1
MDVEPPVSMLAEITHRCPLHCIYCSNPLELVAREGELKTEEWLDVIDQAAELGVLEVHFSGGEPLVRADLERLVARASERGLYTNLITSGVGLSGERVARLREAGLRAVQLSLQAADPQTARIIAGGEFWAQKLTASRAVREAGLALSLNMVLHRHNLHQVSDLLEMALELGAERVELANTQYYGWALVNRAFLLPTREQLEAAEAVVERFRTRVGNRMEILWVIPDYYAQFPKPCMNGWGRMYLTVAPDGRVLPCPVAYVIPDLELPSVRRHLLSWIWYHSPAFNRFRGFGWMPEPCRSCPRRFEDFGGCRCQAFLLTGHPEVTDPVCIYSPHRPVVDRAMTERADGTGWTYRPNPGQRTPLLGRVHDADRHPAPTTR